MHIGGLVAVWTDEPVDAGILGCLRLDIELAVAAMDTSNQKMQVAILGDRKFLPSTCSLQMCGLTRRQPVGVSPSVAVGCSAVTSFGA